MRSSASANRIREALALSTAGAGAQFAAGNTSIVAEEHPVLYRDRSVEKTPCAVRAECLVFDAAQSSILRRSFYPGRGRNSLARKMHSLAGPLTARNMKKEVHEAPNRSRKSHADDQRLARRAPTSHRMSLADFSAIAALPAARRGNASHI